MPDPYKPYLIADFKIGMMLNKKPWRLPPEAFTQMKNAYIYQGVISKRLGYEEYAQISHAADQDLTGYTEVDVGADRITVTASKVAVTDLDNDEAVYDYLDFTADYFAGNDEFELDFKFTDGGGLCGLWALTQDIGGFGDLLTGNKNFIALYQDTANRLMLYARHVASTDQDNSGALTIDTDYWITIKIDRTAGTVICTIYSDVNRSTVVDTLTLSMPDPTDKYRYLYAQQGWGTGGGGLTWDGEIRNLSIITYPAYPVMGIFNFARSTGDTELLVCDTKRLTRFNTVSEKLEDVSDSDTFAGSDSQFFSGTTYYDKFYLLNNVDRLKVWDGSTIENVLVDIDGDAVNDLNTALFSVDYKSRLLLFRPTEGGTLYPQRVRWSKPGTTNYTNDGYVDAPTQDWITGHAFLGDDLIVYFTKSTWFLKYTGDSTLPYRWQMISDHYGGTNHVAPMALDDEVFNVVGTIVTSCDGLSIVPMEDRISDIAIDIANDKMHYCYSQRINELRQLWMAYPETGEDYSNKIFVYNFIEKSVNTYEIDIHCFGYYERLDDVTWDGCDIAWDDMEDIWDAPGFGSGYPIILGGNRTGYLYYLNNTTQDDGTPFDMILDSSKMNPYYNAGKQARFGLLDIFTDIDSDVTLTFEFYKDQSDIAYKTSTVVCSGTGEKAWFRISVNEVGSFHRVKITHTGAQQVNIYALMPWFKSAGRII